MCGTFVRGLKISHIRLEVFRGNGKETGKGQTVLLELEDLREDGISMFSGGIDHMLLAGGWVKDLEPDYDILLGNNNHPKQSFIV